MALDMSRPSLLLAVFVVACGSSPAPDAGIDAGTDIAADARDGRDNETDVADGSAPDTFDAGPALEEALEATAPFTRYVDPSIGSAGVGFTVGNASIAPQRPFGMIRPGPDTGHLDENGPPFYHCAGYYYDDQYIWGFSQTRMHGVGIVDYGHLALMPSDGFDAERTTQSGYRLPFDKESERIEVGYYSAELVHEGDARSRVEITAGERVARYRIGFDASMEPVLIVDLAHTLDGVVFDDGALEIDEDGQGFSGFVRLDGGYSDRHGGVRIFFAARFDQPADGFGTFVPGEVRTDSREVSGAGGAHFHFDGPSMELALAMSFVDVAHARMNLEAEDAPFDELQTSTVDAWEQLLSRVEVEGRGDEALTRFYTALYQTLLMPTLASDVDGAYRGVDDEVHQADFRYSSDLSLWDTFRTQVPMLAWLYPELARDQLRSLVRMAEDGGALPRWPLGHGYTGGMVGDSGAIALADGVMRGVDMDADAAYVVARRAAMEAQVTASGFSGRRDIAGYLERGYVASDRASVSVSATLEFAYADFAVAQLARAAGHDAEASLFDERAGNWRNVWAEGLGIGERGYFVGRDSEGNFDAEFDEGRFADYYSEGNARHYQWYVPHDLPALAEQMGGPDAFVMRLERFFQQSVLLNIDYLPGNYYWQGNEPDIHAPWLFSAFGDPQRSAAWVRWVMDDAFGMGPAGLPGNDDSGTMSAWYVFAALGVFPIAGTDRFLYAAPTLTAATLHIPSADLLIRSPAASDGTLNAVTLNGEVLGWSEGAWLRQDQLRGELVFDVR